MPNLRPLARVQLLSDIGRAVQSTMKVADIPGYLAAFGVKADISEPVTSKWAFVRDVLRGASNDTIVEIARDLGLEVPYTVAPATLDLAKLLSERGMQVGEEDFARALKSVDADPAQAIGHACSSLESICKAILDALSVPLPRDESLQPLAKAVAEQLNLSPDGHADADLKRLLGGLANACAGVAVIRTKYSAFHGKSPNQRRLVGRHARLAVNSAAAVGLFLVETYVARFQATTNDASAGVDEHIAELEEQHGAPFTSDERGRIRKLFRPSPGKS